MLLQRLELFFDVFDLRVLTGLRNPFISRLAEFVLACTGTPAGCECDGNGDNTA
jgi:hypothetical protein